jgi:uncharacterized protein
VRVNPIISHRSNQALFWSEYYFFNNSPGNIFIHPVEFEDQQVPYCGGAMIRVATIETDKAERLMKALCNHFARKITARYEGNKGYIEFQDGKCELTATATTLVFHAEAVTADGLTHVMQAVASHLSRFTPGEDIPFNWRDPA